MLYQKGAKIAEVWTLTEDPSGEIWEKISIFFKAYTKKPHPKPQVPIQHST